MLAFVLILCISPTAFSLDCIKQNSLVVYCSNPEKFKTHYENLKINDAKVEAKGFKETYKFCNLKNEFKAFYMCDMTDGRSNYYIYQEKCHNQRFQRDQITGNNLVSVSSNGQENTEWYTIRLGNGMFCRGVVKIESKIQEVTNDFKTVFIKLPYWEMNHRFYKEPYCANIYDSATINLFNQKIFSTPDAPPEHTTSFTDYVATQTKQPARAYIMCVDQHYNNPILLKNDKSEWLVVYGYWESYTFCNDKQLWYFHLPIDGENILKDMKQKCPSGKSFVRAYYKKLFKGDQGGFEKGQPNLHPFRIDTFYFNEGPIQVKKLVDEGEATHFFENKFQQEDLYKPFLCE